MQFPVWAFGNASIEGGHSLGIVRIGVVVADDSWELKDCYPDFAEKEGESLISTRAETGSSYINNAAKDGYLSVSKFDPKKLRMIQPFQYSRRTRTVARLLAFTLVNLRPFNFRGLRLWHNIKNVKVRTLAGEFYGTFKRLIQ